jgi:hypothetical protein
VSRLIRTIGVPPIASRMFAQIFFTIKVYTAENDRTQSARRPQRRVL